MMLWLIHVIVITLLQESEAGNLLLTYNVAETCLMPVLAHCSRAQLPVLSDLTIVCAAVRWNAFTVCNEIW